VRDCAFLRLTSNPLTLVRRSNKDRPRLLIAGCGDVGLRVARLLSARWTVLGLARSCTADSKERLHRLGARHVYGDLDDGPSLSRLSSLAADAVLHLAPPPNKGQTDPRTQNLLRALSRAGKPPSVLIYGSTSGVYGDCAGARFDETRRVQPQTDRAHRRVDAENQIRRWGRNLGVRVVILRIPGIYATNRAGGHPRDRLLRGSPVLVADEDVYTNHIHADDLARACVAALFHGLPQRVVHVCDHTELKMGDYFDLVADLYDLPRPKRLKREQIQTMLNPMTLSFMSESRRLINARLMRELRLRLIYPTIEEGLQAGGAKKALLPSCSQALSSHQPQQQSSTRIRSQTRREKKWVYVILSG
jgi:nucleoside-diphosphate-sugar epimerase